MNPKWCISIFSENYLDCDRKGALHGRPPKPEWNNSHQGSLDRVEVIRCKVNMRKRFHLKMLQWQYQPSNHLCCRSAVKNFGVERFKRNCLKATDGFNHVLQHLHQRQHQFSEIREKKWQDMRLKSEVLRDKMVMSSLNAAAGRDSS